MRPRRKTKFAPIERTYTVTLVDGTKKSFVGTRIEQTADGDTLIWNEWLLVAGFKRAEFKNIR